MTKTLDEFVAQLVDQLRRNAKEFQFGSYVDVPWSPKFDLWCPYYSTVRVLRTDIKRWRKKRLHAEVLRQVVEGAKDFLERERLSLKLEQERLDKMDEWLGGVENG